MLSFALIFLFAQSALTLPQLDVNFYEITDSPVITDNGQIINRNVTTGAMEYIDGGDMPLYGQMIVTAVNDMADINDPRCQATAALHTLAIMGEMATGIPGNACGSSALINTAANGGNMRLAVGSFLQQIYRYVDLMIDLYLNPSSVRYSAGSRGNCLGGGRTYQFEKVWDNILANCNALESALLNEEYCAARRLYSAWNVRSNNIAAAFTATSIPEIRELATCALPEMGNFLRSLSGDENPSSAGAEAKAALQRCYN